MRIKSDHIIIAVIAAAVAAAGVAAIWFFAGTGYREIKKALDPNTYDTVCVTAEIKTENIGGDGGETGGTAGSDGYYIDGEGNLIESGDEGYPGESAMEPHFETVVTMKRSGDVVHEKGLSGEYFFFNENGKDYVLFFDEENTAGNQGLWTKIPLFNFNLKPLFDPERLSELSAEDFTRVKDGLIPKTESLEKAFHTIFGTSEENRDKHIVYDLTITMEAGRIRTITAVYELNAASRLTQKWSFSYDETVPAMPEAQAEYSGNPVDR